MIRARRRWISPRWAGDALGIFYSDPERRLVDGSATTFGRGLAVLDEQTARMLTVRTTTIQYGDGAGDEAELRSAWTGEGACPHTS